MPAAPLGKSTLFGCPISGEVAPVSQCPDPTFAQEILGPGVVIFPEGCELFAPADARVEFALSTKHALGLGTAEGVKFLIHVGMDTNKLEGDGFQSFAKMGDEVKRGGQAALLRPPGDGGKPLLPGHALCVLQQQGGLGYGNPPHRPRGSWGGPHPPDPQGNLICLVSKNRKRWPLPVFLFASRGAGS